MDHEENAQWCAAHADQLRAIGVPNELYTCLAAKIRDQIFDVGDSVSFMDNSAGCMEGEAQQEWRVVANHDIAPQQDIWLSDHIWLFPGIEAAREQLSTVPELRFRLGILLGWEEDRLNENSVGSLLEAIMPLHGTVALRHPDGTEQHMLYICDEFGSRIETASDDMRPNVAVGSLLDMSQGVSYTLVWPLVHIKQGEPLIRPVDQRTSCDDRCGRYLANEVKRQELLRISHVWTEEECFHMLGALDTITSSKDFTHRRHLNVASQDIPAHRLPPAEYLWLEKTLRHRLFPVVAQRWNLDPDDIFCRDLFFVQYSTVQGGQNKLAIHQDDALISFNILLSDPSDFEGGGTYFKHVNKTVPLQRGGCIVHDSEIPHAGAAITSGYRTILVGFCEHARGTHQSTGAIERAELMLLNVKAREQSRQQQRQSTRSTVTDAEYEAQTCHQSAGSESNADFEPHLELADCLVELEAHPANDRRVMPHPLALQNVIDSLGAAPDGYSDSLVNLEFDCY